MTRIVQNHIELEIADALHKQALAGSSPIWAWLAEFCLHMGFVLRTFTHDFIDICSKNFLIADLFDQCQIRHCNTAGISTVGVSFNV